MNDVKKLEAEVRAWFSRRPMLYALVGGIGVVLFWRGIWHTADAVAGLFLAMPNERGATILFDFMDGIVSLIVGFALLVSTGLFVSDFIGTEVISKGLTGEEKLTKKVEGEEEAEESTLNKIHNEMHGISKRLKKIEQKSNLIEKK